MINKYLKILVWPIIFMIGTFFINYLYVIVFNATYYNEEDLYEIINTYEYQDKLSNFINNNTIYIISITAAIFIPLFYIIYKKYQKNIKLKLNKIIHCIILGIIISSVYNLYLSIITNYQISKLPIIIQIIASGIIGPIIEELLFRGIIYNKLKEFNTTKKAMIISTIIFSIFHGNMIDIIYTLFIGYILVYIYEKYKSIKYPIILHITANTTVILLSIIISLNILLINIILFIISLIILIKIIYKKILVK